MKIIIMNHRDVFFWSVNDELHHVIQPSLLLEWNVVYCFSSEDVLKKSLKKNIHVGLLAFDDKSIF